jgi:hypothetical protein
MSGIYIHIPFASRHVITVIFIFDFDEEERGDGMAIAKELQMRKSEFERNKLRPFILVVERQVF